MNQQLQTSRAHLEHAQALLREVLQNDSVSAKGDAASLDRILVHIRNINEAVATSDESHLNAAKRLADFAITSTRMSARNPKSTVQLNKLAEILREAGTGITAAQSLSAEAAPAEAEKAAD